ncbi:hypothetical protein QBC46DRAFT_4114 [Diplogelasinospora grovesii]|uniref:DUF3669 domain-containing protein n=1 Tax=Diplogelasinospora grovesii TaxID=303347 RepID=A0AAN6NJM3_9PEZI|nr:hypothetical protein QBC46DRAFT_4114 [Diplogelasinospora grovesii]
MATLLYRQERTDRSDDTTLSEGLARAVCILELLETDATSTLLRTLSTKSAQSTTLDFASRMNNARSANGFFDIIGEGTCGTVFEMPGTAAVAKVGSVANIRGLWRDFVFAGRAHQAIFSARPLLAVAFPGLELPHVPAALEFHRHDDAAFWDATTARLADPTHHYRPLHIAERIPPVPEPTRHALIHCFFEPDARDDAAEDPANAACLVRPYFGSRRPEGWAPTTLWNFPLWADAMEQIGLDADVLVCEMALGLAVLHWRAGLEASDVEFVLGTSAIKPALPTSVDSPVANIYAVDLRKRATHLYLLDFDKARDFRVDEPEQDLLPRLVAGVEGNDPYYPRPEINRQLWAAFANAYLEASAILLRDNLEKEHKTPAEEHRVLRLPQKFIDAWVTNMAEKVDNPLEDAIEFGGGGDAEDEGWGSDELGGGDQEDSDEDDEDSGEDEDSDEDDEDSDEEDGDDDAED